MFRSLASSSSGNLYTCTDGRTSLLIEAGLPIKRMLFLLDHDLSRFSAALITHEHKDHSESAGELLRRGMPVWCSSGTARACGIEAEAERAEHNTPFKVGTFVIVPFETRHDAAEPLGFLIYSAFTGEKLVFATDTEFIPATFNGLSEVAMECNYVDELLISGNRPLEAKKRVMHSHMGLKAVLKFLSDNKIAESRVHTIWLLHMSDEHGHAEEAKRAVQELTGKVVYVA